MEKDSKMRLKRYWFRDWRDGNEYIANAYSAKDLKRKVGTERLQILKVYHKKNLKESDLILRY